MTGSLEYEFIPRLSVPDFEEYFREERELSEKVRASRRSILDIPYGNTERSRLDLFPGTSKKLPTLVFVHGGYWRSRHKDDFSFIANAVDQAQAGVMVIGYDLCPIFTVQQIVEQIQKAILWISKNADDYGCRGDKLVLCGHSAGAHLLAAQLTTRRLSRKLSRELISSMVLISGIYRLDPVLQISVNNDVRLTSSEAKELSPMQYPLDPLIPLDIVVGSAETQGWQSQSSDFFAVVQQQSPLSTFHCRPGLNHFSIMRELAAPDRYIARILQARLAEANR
jgi:arylformamidase